ncbi:MAG: LacI family DNA-binding transcriptional regulator [Sphaerochaetaceae bacterium]
MVTIKEIAWITGCAVSTVSRALNNTGEISPETREKILKAAHDLNYIPNIAARQMVQRKSNTIGLTIPDINDTYFSESASGVEEVMKRQGFDVVYGSLSRDPERLIEFIERAQTYRYDGLIITPDQWSEPLVDKLRRVEIPVIALRRRPPEDLRIPYVDTDHFQSAREMTEYLLGIGHTRIAHIELPTLLGLNRKHGYEQTMRQHGLEPVSVAGGIANRVMDAIHSGRLSMEKLLSRQDIPTAVFCGSDYLAMGAMEYLYQHSVKVPQDISIAGFDNVELSQLSWFNLTTMVLQRKEMGCKAASMLCQMMQEKVKKPRSVLYGTELVVRGSTSAPLAH